VVQPIGGQRGDTECHPKGPKYSIVSAMGIARGQPKWAMKFHGPAQEPKTVRRGLPAADENPVDVEINTHRRQYRFMCL
jgi:hypothetical protein